MNESVVDERASGDELHYDDAHHDHHPHRHRWLANQPLVEARFQAALDMERDGVSRAELSWTFNVTIQGVTTLLQRAKAWHEWRYGYGGRRSTQVPKYLKGEEGERGVPSRRARARREGLVA